VIACDEWQPPFCFKYSDRGITTRIQNIHRLKKGKVTHFESVLVIEYFFYFYLIFRHSKKMKEHSASKHFKIMLLIFKINIISDIPNLAELLSLNSKINTGTWSMELQSQKKIPIDIKSQFNMQLIYLWQNTGVASHYMWRNILKTKILTINKVCSTSTICTSHLRQYWK
jgi:hypothetical protein